MFNVSQANTELLNLYNFHWPKLKEIVDSGPDLWGPHLIEIPPQYGAASTKLMIVGQQAYEWGKNTATDITELITLYRDFLSETDKVPSPFWHFSREINKGINPDCSEVGFVWTNVYKIDRNNQRPGDPVEQHLLGMNLLEKEIEICSPDFVVFFTGPYFDESLKAIFPGLQFEPLINERFLHRVVHAKLPVNSFRTYHPRYLRAKGWEKEIKQAIINSI